MANSVQLGVADLLERFGFLWHPLDEDATGGEPVVEITEATVAKIQSLVGTVYRINRMGDPYIPAVSEESAEPPLLEEEVGMTFQEAMESLEDFAQVRRRSWPAGRVLCMEESCDEKGRNCWFIADHKAHLMGGSTFGDYFATPEDEAATDWESHTNYY